MAERHKKLYKTMRLLAYGVTVASRRAHLCSASLPYRHNWLQAIMHRLSPSLSPAANLRPADAQIIPDQYIVVFNEAHLCAHLKASQAVPPN